MILDRRLRSAVDPRFKIIGLCFRLTQAKSAESIHVLAPCRTARAAGSPGGRCGGGSIRLCPIGWSIAASATPTEAAVPCGRISPLEAQRANDVAEVVDVVLDTASSTRHADGVLAVRDRDHELHMLVGVAIALEGQNLKHARIRA